MAQQEPVSTIPASIRPLPELAASTFPTPTPILAPNLSQNDDDQPYFPADLFQNSTWSLRDLKHIEEIGKGKYVVPFLGSFLFLVYQIPIF